MTHGQRAMVGSTSPTVRLELRYSDPRPRGGGAVRGPVETGARRRLSAWVVRAVVLATTGFALLDLSLLVVGLRH